MTAIDYVFLLLLAVWIKKPNESKLGSVAIGIAALITLVKILNAAATS